MNHFNNYLHIYLICFQIITKIKFDQLFVTQVKAWKKMNNDQDLRGVATISLNI